MKKRVISFIISVASMFSLTGITANAGTSEDYLNHLKDLGYERTGYEKLSDDYSFLSNIVEGSYGWAFSNDMYLRPYDSIDDPDAPSLQYDLMNVLRFGDNIGFTIDEAMLAETDLSELKKQINEVNNKFMVSAGSRDGKGKVSFGIYCKDEKRKDCLIDTSDVKKVYAILENIVDSFDYHYDRFCDISVHMYGLTAYSHCIYSYSEDSGNIIVDSSITEKIEEYIQNSGINAQIMIENNVVYVVPSDNISLTEQLDIAKDIYNETGLLPNYHAIPESCLKVSEASIDVYNAIDGDTNNDGELTVADAAAILQYLGNTEQYPISAQGKFNAELDGSDGITVKDAIELQKLVAQRRN